MKIFVVGSINMDLVISAPFMPKSGMTIKGDGFMTNPGGKGANQAVALGNLGAEAIMVGCVGNEFGNTLKSTLKEHNVNIDYVRKIDNVSSGIAVIVVTNGDNRIIIDEGANAKISTDLIDEALEQATEGDWLVCQLEIPQSIISYALKKAKSKNMTTVLNPAPANALQSGILEHADWFIPNQSEAEFYTGIYPKTESSVKECAKKLFLQGVKSVLITMGELGSACVTDKEYIKVPAFPVKAVDTTAAGDTYVGAFVTRLSEGASIKTAMAFASKAASITVTSRGAQKSIPKRNQIEEEK